MKWFKKDEPVELTAQEQIELLIRLLFRDEFDDNIDYSRRYKMLFALSRNQTLIGWLKNRYTRIYKSANFDRLKDSDTYQKGVYAGRLIEVLDLLNQLETISEVDKDQYVEQQNQADAMRAKFGTDKIKKDSSHLINKTY